MCEERGEWEKKESVKKGDSEGRRGGRESTAIVIVVDPPNAGRWMKLTKLPRYLLVMKMDGPVSIMQPG